VFFASFSPTQSSFSCPVPCCLNSKCTRAHLFAHGCVQARCWRVAILRNWKQLRHWPTKTWSKVKYFLCYLKGVFVISKHTWILKGMGDDTLIGLLHITPKTHPWLIKRQGTTIFSIVKLAKVDSDKCHALQTMCLDRFRTECLSFKSFICLFPWKVCGSVVPIQTLVQPAWHGNAGSTIDVTLRQEYEYVFLNQWQMGRIFIILFCDANCAEIAHFTFKRFVPQSLYYESARRSNWLNYINKSQYSSTQGYLLR